MQQSILAKAKICQARFLRLANFSAAKTRTTTTNSVFVANDYVVRYNYCISMAVNFGSTSNKSAQIP